MCGFWLGVYCCCCCCCFNVGSGEEAKWTVRAWELGIRVASRWDIRDFDSFGGILLLVRGRL